MTQLKELLEKEELDYINEVREDLEEESIAKEKSTNGSKAWIWVAAIIAAFIVLK